MRTKACLTSVLLVAAAAFGFGQSTIPAGTVLAVELRSSLNSQKTRPGSTITARVMQEIQLSSPVRIRAGSELLGKVVSVTPAGAGKLGGITLRFDELTFAHRPVAITTSLRALASMLEVEDAQVPKTGADRGTPWAWATRVLIGGEVAYGAGGPVARGSYVLGQALVDGVLVPVEADPDLGCRGDFGVVPRLQALWVFSSNACGLYGFSDLRIVHAGRSKPRGDITLTSVEGKIDIKRGSGLLLRVD